ncbi:VOC family protein [Modestobacter sp. I12A-02662]|uniref:VOC family protein n=1 Tax=Modestobacter sp. I12A-02662 TaxID=1730496 RepID=UPI0034DE4C45
MTSLGGVVPTTHAITRDLTGIVVVSIPVTDLAVSAAWYCDLLDLELVREFGDENTVTGCALADFAAHYMVALRRRDATAGHADLRGEHPIIVEAVDAEAAERVRARAAELGVASTSGQHADGAWIEFVDPDGIALRVVHSANGPQHFIGVISTADAAFSFYDTPRLDVPRRVTTVPTGCA